MSTPTRHMPSRRTVLRTAAWSTAAVTVVVATPNIAAASTGIPLSLSMSGSTNTRRNVGASGKDDVVWTFTIRNDAASAIAGGTLTGVFGATPAASVTSVTSTTGTWTNGTYTGIVEAGGTVTLSVTFRRNVTGPGGTATASFTASGWTGSVAFSHAIT